MIDGLASLEAAVSANHWLAAGVLLLATLVLEDAATVTAGVLAAGGVLPAPIALGAVYCGIIAGDSGLYWVGRAAISTRWAERFITPRNLGQGRRWLRRRLIPALIGARFTPGMRMPTFLASGFLKIPFWRYFSVILCVAAVWTTGIFALIYHFGPVIAQAIGKDAWILGLGIVILAFGVPLYLRRRANRKSAATQAPKPSAAGSLHVDGDPV